MKHDPPSLHGRCNAPRGWVRRLLNKSPAAKVRPLAHPTFRNSFVHRITTDYNTTRRARVRWQPFHKRKRRNTILNIPPRAKNSRPIKENGVPAAAKHISQLPRPLAEWSLGHALAGPIQPDRDHGRFSGSSVRFATRTRPSACANKVRAKLNDAVYRP